MNAISNFIFKQIEIFLPIAVARHSGRINLEQISKQHLPQSTQLKETNDFGFSHIRNEDWSKKISLHLPLLTSLPGKF